MSTKPYLLKHYFTFWKHYIIEHILFTFAVWIYIGIIYDMFTCMCILEICKKIRHNLPPPHDQDLIVMPYTRTITITLFFLLFPYDLCTYYAPIVYIHINLLLIITTKIVKNLCK